MHFCPFCSFPANRIKDKENVLSASEGAGSAIINTAEYQIRNEPCGFVIIAPGNSVHYLFFHKIAALQHIHHILIGFREIS